MIKDVEQLFMCLLVSYIFSFVKCLLKIYLFQIFYCISFEFLSFDSSFYIFMEVLSDIFFVAIFSDHGKLRNIHFLNCVLFFLIFNVC